MCRFSSARSSVTAASCARLTRALIRTLFIPGVAYSDRAGRTLYCVRCAPWLRRGEQIHVDGARKEQFDSCSPVSFTKPLLTY